jgi:hypothetical protein
MLEAGTERKLNVPEIFPLVHVAKDHNISAFSKIMTA